MPEFPDLTVYLEALERRVVGHRLEHIRLASPFLVRTADPSLTAAHGKVIKELRRIGKRIVFGLEEDLFVVVHLMIAGLFQWRQAGVKIPARIGLAAFGFSHGTLQFTEAGTKKLASLHLVHGEAALRQFDSGGTNR
jgi:formamidopyrimidine-DNA glycosylase